MQPNDASSSSRHFEGATPFKVKVKFDIPIFEGQIDEYVLAKWLSMLEGYFPVHDFSDRENITFSILKVSHHVKDWWETYYEYKDEREPSLFSTTPTWNSFQDAIKEQYYPVGFYEDKYIKWTTLPQGRDEDIPQLTNIFNTLHTMLGINDFEQNLVPKFHDCLHK